MMFIKRAMAAVLLTVGSLGLASAANVDQAFRALTGGASSTTQPGVFQSATRTTAVLGGFDMRVPRTTTTSSLISITPPRLDFGCGGISAHFGGFSFINGDEIKNLVRGIAQNAQGLAVNLAMRVLCPQCQAVIEHMTSLASQAAKVNMDACNVAANLTDMLEDGLFTKSSQNDKDRVKLTCSSEAAGQGRADDFGAAFSRTCASLKDGLAMLQSKVDEWNKQDHPNQQAADEGESNAQLGVFKEGGKGNKTWLVLNNLNLGASDARIGNQLVMLNLLGTTIRDEEGETKTWAPTLDGETLFHFAMCGVREPGWMNQAKYQFMRKDLSAYCAESHKSVLDAPLDQVVTDEQGGQSRYLILDCKDQEYKLCNQIQWRHISEVPAIMEGTGFVYQVARLLIDATEAIANDQALDPDAIAMMNAAPYPLYQAVNIAAVYPATAANLVGNMSFMVAESMTYSYIDTVLRNSVTSEGKPVFDGATYSHVAELVNKFRNLVFQHRTKTLHRFELQQAINENIRTINQSIQRQVMSEDLLNANRFAGVIVSPKKDAN